MILDSYGRPVDPKYLVRAERTDRWENNWTGIGTDSDKTTHGRFFPTMRIMDQELRQLRDGSDLVARLVEDSAHEMFREGYLLTGRIRKDKKSGSPTDAADDVSESDANDMREFCEEEFELDDTVEQALIEGRYWGGCLNIMGVDDGGFPWEPLNEDRIRSFDYLSLIDRRYAYVQSQYSGMQAKKYGTAEIYLIANAIAGTGWNAPGEVRRKSPEELRASGGQIQFIHESRVIRFDGTPADIQSRQRLAGWSWSVIQRIYDTMRQFEHAFDSVGYMLSEASIAVYKLFGLMKAIRAGQKMAVMERALIMEQSRSVMHGMLLDAGDGTGKNAETFERVPIPFGSIPELLDRFMMRISAAFDGIPLSRLFGRAPAGLNATGESETRAWYDRVRSIANKRVAPRIKRVYRLAALAKNSPLKGKKVDWTVDFKPLWAPTDLEAAQAKYQNAQADQIYADSGIVSPEEIALGLKEVYPSLDLDSREAAMKDKVTHDPHENDEPNPNLGPGEPLGKGAPIPTLGPAASPEGAGAKKAEPPKGPVVLPPKKPKPKAP